MNNLCTNIIYKYGENGKNKFVQPNSSLVASLAGSKKSKTISEKRTGVIKCPGFFYGKLITDMVVDGWEDGDGGWGRGRGVHKHSQVAKMHLNKQH